MRYFLLAAVAALLATLAPTAAQAGTGTCNGATVTTTDASVPLCSINIQMTGPCTGGNVLGTINAAQAPEIIGSNHITPWQPGTVTIRGYQAKFFWSGHIIYTEVGNGGGSPDIMGGLGEGETEKLVMYPADTGFAFYNVPGAYLDHHVACSPGPGVLPNGQPTTYASFNVLLTLFYTAL